MESHSPLPLALTSSMLADVRVREACVDKEEVMLWGRDAWNALRQLIVRGIPLKEMHLRPTSRMNSAVRTCAVWESPRSAEATVCRIERASGELSVNVAAAYPYHVSLSSSSSFSSPSSLHTNPPARYNASSMAQKETHRDRQPRPRTNPPPPRLARNPPKQIPHGRRRRSALCDPVRPRPRKGRVDERLEAGRELGHGAASSSLVSC